MSDEFSGEDGFTFGADLPDELKTKLPIEEVLEAEEGYNHAWWYDDHPDNITVLTAEFDNDDVPGIVEINDREDGFGASAYFDTNVDTLKAINTHVMTVLKPKAQQYHNDNPILWIKRWGDWSKAIGDWQLFYKTTIDSTYVSDDDIAHAKAKRDAMNMIVMPEATKIVKATSKDAGASYTEKQQEKFESEQPMSIGTKIAIGVGVVAALYIGSLTIIPAAIGVFAAKKIGVGGLAAKAGLLSA